jgi:hypothetical protein
MFVSRVASVAFLSALALASTAQRSLAQEANGAAPGAEVTGDTIVFGQTAAQSGPNAPRAKRSGDFKPISITRTRAVALRGKAAAHQLRRRLSARTNDSAR